MQHVLDEMVALRDLAVTRMNPYLYESQPKASCTLDLEDDGRWHATVRDRYGVRWEHSGPMPTPEAAMGALRMNIEGRKR